MIYFGADGTEDELHLFTEVEPRSCYALGLYKPDETVAKASWNHGRPGTMDRACDESIEIIEEVEESLELRMRWKGLDGRLRITVPPRGIPEQFEPTKGFG